MGSLVRCGDAGPGLSAVSAGTRTPVCWVPGAPPAGLAWRGVATPWWHVAETGRPSPASCFPPCKMAKMCSTTQTPPPTPAWLSVPWTLAVPFDTHMHTPSPTPGHHSVAPSWLCRNPASPAPGLLSVLARTPSPPRCQALHAVASSRSFPPSAPSPGSVPGPQPPAGTPSSPHGSDPTSAPPPTVHLGQRPPSPLLQSMVPIEESSTSQGALHRGCFCCRGWLQSRPARAGRLWASGAALPPQPEPPSPTWVSLPSFKIETCLV